MTFRPCVLLICAALAWPVAARAQQIEGELVASGLDRPVKFVQHPTLPTVQLIVQQGGVIRVLDAGVLGGTYADLTGMIAGTGEQGLLGLAFAPDFATSRRVFLNFTNPAGNTVIARFLQPNDTTVALDMASRFDLVWPGGNAFILQPFTNHNAGDLAFGADGYLYIPLGDGGSGDDPAHNAQTPGTLLGKILRIDVSVADSDPQGYDVPADNPFVGQIGYLPEIWAFGLRNPWRFSVDDPARGGTGGLIIGDVGQVSYEEVNYQPPGVGGLNYGWRNREGAHPHIADPPPAYTPLTDPILEYPRVEGHSITGGFIYRGTALGTHYQGRYFFGDFVFSRVWSVAVTINPMTGQAVASDLREHTATLGAAATNPSAFGVDGAGELYVVNYTGTVHRLVVGDFIDNGGFDAGVQANGVPLDWLTWATPTPADIVFTAAGSQMSFRRPTGSTQAVVFQQTGVPLATGEPVEAVFTLGSTHSARLRISAVLHDEDFSDVTVCTFWLDPFSPAALFRMQTHSTSPWTGATLSFYAATESDSGLYTLDSVSLRRQPTQSATRTTCVDPHAPVGAAPASGNLLVNGAFTAGLSPWGLFGSIVSQLAAGVFEFYGVPGPFAGVVLQNTGAPMADEQRLEATFSLGNSAPTRQRVTVLIHDQDFTDLHACTFYVEAGQALSAYTIRTYTTKAWAGASLSFYAATPGSAGTHEWLRLDDVTLSRVAATTVGTECVEPG